MAILRAMGVFGSSEFQRFGNYILLDRINVGGMAEVFRGKQVGVEGFARLVALKRILPNISADQDFIDMFIDEAKLAVQMHHANIVQIYDLGQAEGSYYIAMEYIPGVDLKTVWDRARRRNRLLPIAMSAYIMQRVAEGLDFAHRKRDDRGNDIGLVHRDVSPQNVLISFEGEVKVVDFGIAKAKNKVSKTQAGTLKGKFGYMSPEQVRGIELDNRSDIFAVGAVLYELIVGERLFLGESDFSTLEKVRNVEMVPPSQLNKSLSPKIERIVMKALQKNRDDRYRHTSEVGEDLQRYLFESNQPFQRTDLARYMKQHFKAEIDKEYERLERYRDVSLANVPAPPSRAAEASEDIEITVNDPNAEQEYSNQAAPTAASVMPAATPLPAAMPAATPIAPAVTMTPTPTAPPGLPTWAKGLIASLSVLVVIALSLVIWVVGFRGATSQSVPQSGSLTLDVTPVDAEIWLNSNQVATQSPFAADLPAKTHVLEIRKDGYKRVLRPIRIEAGQTRVETIILEAEAVKASLLIRSKPKGASVWIDGKDTEFETPATITQLPAGVRELELRRDGVSVYKTKVTLKTGEVEAMEVDLTRLPTTLKVHASRTGARVTINGRAKGVTPLVLTQLKPGVFKVRVELDKCDPYVERVRLEAAATIVIQATMQCEGGAPDDKIKGIGRLNVTTTVMADVFVDGKKQGRTPVLGLPLPVGKHLLKLVPLAGDKPPHEKSFETKPGRALSISHQF
jgi:serine/threonine protein kinase